MILFIFIFFHKPMLENYTERILKESDEKVASSNNEIWRVKKASLYPYLLWWHLKEQKKKKKSQKKKRKKKTQKQKG